MNTYEYLNLWEKKLFNKTKKKTTKTMKTKQCAFYSEDIKLVYDLKICSLWMIWMPLKHRFYQINCSNNFKYISNKI